MSCSTCGCSPCTCFTDCYTPTIFACTNEDPGIVSAGRFLAVYDSQFNLRRLAATGNGGLLVLQLDGSGNYVITTTTEPNVLSANFPVGLDVPFTGLLAELGAMGTINRLFPTAPGFIRANADGTFQVTALPSATVPDPLTVTTLNAAIANLTTVLIDGTPTFSNLLPDTVTQTIGLNAADELVLGPLATGSVAQFFESPTRISAAQPNASKNDNDYLEIAQGEDDPDGIASISNSQTIRIDTAGTFKVEWGVGFQEMVTGGGNDPQGNKSGAHLEINSAIVSYGNGKYVNQWKFGGSQFSGVYTDVLAINDMLRVKYSRVGNSGAAGGSGIFGAGVTLTRIK